MGLIRGQIAEIKGHFGLDDRKVRCRGPQCRSIQFGVAVSKPTVVMLLSESISAGATASEFMNEFQRHADDGDVVHRELSRGVFTSRTMAKIVSNGERICFECHTKAIEATMARAGNICRHERCSSMVTTIQYLSSFNMMKRLSIEMTY